MIGDFFIWCAGSDTIVLSNCENSVRIKHIGLGTLVLIPAALGTVSMGYALSTIVKLQYRPEIYITGGIFWGLIIFAFDRFIVSTHKRQQRNIDEFLNLTFYIRILFAFVLGIVVSHPFVLLFYGDSIQTQIKKDETIQLRHEEKVYDQDYDTELVHLNGLLKERGGNQQLLTAEQSGGPVFRNAYGITSGKSGVGGRARIILDHIHVLEADIATERTRIAERAKKLQTNTFEAQKTIRENTNFSYLAEVTALSELEDKYRSVWISEIFIMAAFMLVDILPLIFKTFAPFSLYDKILVDDIGILRTVNTDVRKQSLQKAYNRTIGMYNAIKRLEEPFNYNEYLKELSKNLNLSKNVFMGVALGTLITLFLILRGKDNLTSNQFFTIGTACSVLVGIIGNLATDGLKLIGKKVNDI